MTGAKSSIGATTCLIAVAVLSIAATLAGCHFPEPQPQARFDITDWKQDYYEYLGYYSLVEIFYRVTNTGSVNIDYYQVWIEVQCADGSTYQEWTNGLNVPPGSYTTDWTMIDTAEKRAVSVRVTRYELTHYSY